MLAPGEVLSGTYEIRGLLGWGAMGQVFEARDRLLERRVAIKVAWPHADAVALRQEARALAAIRHPAMVGVYALANDKGLEYLVMERVYGISLAAHLGRRELAGEPFTVSEAVEVLLALTDGLAAVHRAGIAHRDVKPDNVMLAPNNRVVLLDFGVFFPEAGHQLQQPVGGTPLYMAPEAISNSVEPGCWHLVDIYAVGVIAFEMLTGDVPFRAENVVDVWKRHLEDPIPDLHQLRPNVPRELAAIVTEMLAKDPNERPPRMEAVVWALRRLRGRLAGPAPTPGFEALIVDDEPYSMNLLRRCLQAAAPDAQIRTAREGKTALQMIGKRTPHLLLIDLQMPTMNGLELAMALRGTHLADHCTIVAVSARATEHDVQLLHQLGITRFLRKDATLPEALRQTVAELRRLAGTSSLGVRGPVGIEG